MAKERMTRRQKDVSRLLRERKNLSRDRIRKGKKGKSEVKR